MAVLRERPVRAVQLPRRPRRRQHRRRRRPASRKCSGIGMEVTVAEYRNGNEKENSVRKITGLNKATDVTLKRGVIGSLNLYNWLDQIRNGDQNALRTVTVQLQNEDHTGGRADLEAAARADHQAHRAARSTPRAPTWRWRSSSLAYERLEME